MINAPIDISNTTLETKRLILRPFCQDDLADFFAYASVKGVGEWAGWPPHQNIEESQKILDSFIKHKKTFALVDKVTNHVIGSIGIELSSFPEDMHPESTVREIGYVLAKNYWGHGLMSEAVTRIIEYCFNDLHLDYLTVCHFAKNNRSRRVIEKMGFKYIYRNTYHTQMGTNIDDNRCYILENPSKKK